MAFTEDLTVFFSTDDFAVSATYKVNGTGSGSTVKVIFNVTGINTLEVTEKNPIAVGKTSDFPSVGNTDTITINGTVYRIVDSQPKQDGAIIELQLEDQT